MKQLIENVEHAMPFALADLVTCEAGKVTSRTLAKQPGVNMTLMSFAQEEGISTHAAPGDALAYILEGTAQITIADQVHQVTAGQAVVMPGGVPHGVKAIEAFKMLLVVVKECIG